MIYKKLGDFISEIDIRNVEEKTDGILGVSVSKVFIPTIANTIGTDFSKYKVIKRNEFAYIPDTSRRGDKIGIALLNQQEEALVSQAYTVFKTSDDLLPEYLMLWFQRPEFDRYARYHSIGSAREVFSWDDMCNVELPIPSIEEQKEIIRKYKVITDRIKVLTEINKKLEEIATGLFNTDGEKSEYSLRDFLSLISGFAFKSEFYQKVGKYKIVTIKNVQDGFIDTTNVTFLSDYPKNMPTQCLLDIGDILLSLTGNVGRVGVVCEKNLLLNQRVAKVRLIDENMRAFVYFLLRRPQIRSLLEGATSGTAQQNLSPIGCLDIRFLLNNKAIESAQMMSPIFNMIMHNNTEIQKLTELKDVLLPKLMTGYIN